MSSKESCCAISFRGWWVIFLVINKLIIGGMIASLTVESWVTCELGSGQKDFEGCLTKAYEPNDDSYTKNKDDICDQYDLTKEAYVENSGTSKIVLNQLNSLCKMFKHLDTAGLIYIVLDSAAAFTVALWSGAMVLYWVKGKGIIASFITAPLSLILHFVAIGVFMGTSNTLFGTCDDFPTNGDAPRLCAGVGPAISIAVLILLIIEMIAYLIVACKIYKSCGHLGLSIIPESVSNHSANAQSKGSKKSGDQNKTIVQNLDNDVSISKDIFQNTSKEQITYENEYPMSTRRN